MNDVNDWEIVSDRPSPHEDPVPGGLSSIHPDEWKDAMTQLHARIHLVECQQEQILREMEGLREQMKRDLEPIAEYMRKKNAEMDRVNLLDARQQNLKLRQKIPFSFVPQHTASTLGLFYR